MIADSNQVLMWSSLVCLGVFLIGCLHHLLEAVVLFLNLIYKLFKVVCPKGQVKPINFRIQSANKQPSNSKKDFLDN